MSADNLVYALPFQKMTGEVVWRVAEVFLSSLPWDLCHLMSTESRIKQFQEFDGPDAGRQAHAAALRIARKLPVCEYGTTLVDLDHAPFPLAQLQEDAVRAGYKADAVYALREASDEELAHKEIAYWAEQ